MDKRTRAANATIEWAGLRDRWHVDRVGASDVLPPGIAKIEVWRDESYEIAGKLTCVPSVDVDVSALLLGRDKLGTLRAGFELVGTDSFEARTYTLTNCFISRVAPYQRTRLDVPHFEGDPRYKGETYYEATIEPESVKRIASRASEPAWLTEWYLNGPKRLLFDRSTTRGFQQIYQRQRESVDAHMAVFSELQGPGWSLDYSFIQTEDRRFIVHKVPEGHGPTWSHNLGIEYRREWGIPEPAEREAISEIVSFVLGKHLLSVGTTTFDQSGVPIEEVICSPWGRNVIRSCEDPERPPVNVDPRRERRASVETLLQELVPRYLALRDELKLNMALWHYWASLDMPLGTELVMLGAGVELLMNAWFKSNKSPSKAVTMEKATFDELLEDELLAISKKLEAIPNGIRVFRKLSRAYEMGTSEKPERFFQEIGLPIGKIEEGALAARNKPAHGSVDFSPPNVQEIGNARHAYQTLFNRVFLRLLGYQGTYIDRSMVTDQWPDRPIMEPLGGTGEGR